MSRALPLLLIVVVVAFVGGALLLGGDSDESCDGYAFPKERWRAATKDGGASAAEAEARGIAREARRCGVLAGLRPEEVEALLGPPDDRGDERWRWDLGRNGLILVDEVALEVAFRGGRVVAASSP